MYQDPDTTDLQMNEPQLFEQPFWRTKTSHNARNKPLKHGELNGTISYIPRDLVNRLGPGRLHVFVAWRPCGHGLHVWKHVDTTWRIRQGFEESIVILNTKISKTRAGIPSGTHNLAGAMSA